LLLNEGLVLLLKLQATVTITTMTHYTQDANLQLLLFDERGVLRLQPQHLLPVSASKHSGSTLNEPGGGERRKCNGNENKRRNECTQARRIEKMPSCMMKKNMIILLLGALG
jgi:hypothetical protein